MALTIAPFKDEDLEPLVPVLRAAFKAERDYRWTVRMHVAVQPECSLVARLDGRVVGFGAATVYGPFSYVGMMGTEPAVQRQGVAARVLDTLVSLVEARGCPTLLLDASAAGQHLYESRGFRTSDKTVVFRREGEADAVQPGAGEGLSREIGIPELTAFDSPAFGADRSRLLAYLKRTIPERFLVSRDSRGSVVGYLVAQGQTIGPWVASERDVAEKLLSRALQEYSFESGPEVFVSESNTDALGFLARHGFMEQRRLSHMYKGQSIERARATKIYGQASLGLG